MIKPQPNNFKIISKNCYQLSICTLLLFFNAMHAYGQSTDSVRKDSVKTDLNYLHHQKVTAYILPAALITYGVLSFHVNALTNFDKYVRSNVSTGHGTFMNHTDDFLQYSPAAAVYALNIFGVKSKHDFADRTGAYLLSEGIMASATWTLKHAVNRLRPNGLDYYSFPSGHAGTAFTAAEFFSQEYGDQSAWYTVAGYTVATTVSFLRVYNDYHLFSDVIAGAGIGIASTKLAYLVYPVIRKKLWPHKKNFVAMPSYQNSTLGFYLAGQF